MTPPAPSPPSVPFALPVRRAEVYSAVDIAIRGADGITICRAFNVDEADAIVRAINAFYCPSAQATTHNQE